MTLTFLVMVTLIVVFTQRGCGFFPKRRTMKKLNKVAMLFASVALATTAVAQAGVMAANGGKTVDNWVNGPVRSFGKTAPTNCAGVMPTGPLPLPPSVATAPWFRPLLRLLLRLPRLLLRLLPLLPLPQSLRPLPSRLQPPR
jgi:hypothetical protein